MLPQQALGCPEGCHCTECSFSYKHYPPGPGTTTPPDIIYRPALVSDTLHCAERHVLVGDRVYRRNVTDLNGDSVVDAKDVHCLAPALPDPNAKWLWISDDPGLSYVCLYAVKCGIITKDADDIEGVPQTDDVFTTLKVWKWVEDTDTTTLIIDQEYLVEHGASNAFQVDDGLRIHFKQPAFPGNFDNPVSYKLGDVRHARIVIAGTATWYNEGSGEYKYNTEIRCWDLDGVMQWTTNLGGFYHHEAIRVYAADGVGAPGWSSYAPQLLDSQNHYAGYPYPIRVRIGDDLGAYVLTRYSRIPTDYGFKWDVSSYGRYEDGPSSQPCLWKVCEDVVDPLSHHSSSVIPVADFKIYGRGNGDVFTNTEFHYMEPGGPGLGDEDLFPPELLVDFNGPYYDPAAPTDGYWLSWDSATGGTPPYVYDVYKDNVLLAANVTSPYNDAPADLEAPHIDYRIKVTDSTVPTPKDHYSGAVNIKYRTYSVKLQWPRDFDVASNGDVYITLRMASGHGLVMLGEGDILTDDTDDSDTDPNGSRLKGYTFNQAEDEFIYHETTPEYAGPICNPGGSGEVLILRSGVNGTYLVGVMLNNDPESEYPTNRPWSCSFWPHLNIERIPNENHIVTAVASGTVTDLFGDTSFCQPCTPAEDDPCTDCPDKTRKPAWKMLDSPLKDDAGPDHFATKFMQCQMLGFGTVDNVLIEGVITNDVPVHELCDAVYGPYAGGALFRPYTPYPGGTDTNCSWRICGPSIKICQPGFESTDPPAWRIFCSGGFYNVPFATLGKGVGGVFELKFWRAWIDLTTGEEHPPEVFVVYQTEDPEEICGPTATFHKVLDNSAGEVEFYPTGNPYPYYGLPYFRDVIRMKRVVMETDCDIPIVTPPPPEPWCPGSSEPIPEKLWWEAVSPPGPIVYEGEPFDPDGPGDLVFNGTNQWTGGSAKITMNCGGTSVETSLTFYLAIDDPNDPDAVFTIHYTWGSSELPHTGTITINPGTWACPDLEMQGSMSHPVCYPHNFTFFGLTIKIYYTYPDPVGPLRGSPPRKPAAQKKTPEDLPCKFRGGYLNTISCCGDVYQCKAKTVKERACTINANTIESIAVCDGCPSRSPAGDRETLRASGVDSAD